MGSLYYIETAICLIAWCEAWCRVLIDFLPSPLLPIRGSLMTNQPILIELVRETNPVLLKSLNDLLPQLSMNAKAMTMQELQQIVGAECSDLLVVKGAGGENILGALTLIHFRIPTGVRAWIEDVVVDAGARGQGVGKALIQAAVERSHALGAKTLDLTSNPNRESAHRLYEGAGFSVRETKVYRYLPA
ncbi:Acetyltransferase (GNAT) family protein [Pseudomonas sp. NFACC08-1]|nr:Acetyltransferase (GNAT) family protein [Pseudomonas sp. NFACC08-1]